MLNLDGLREELSAYDGRSSTILSEISVKYRRKMGFHSDLITLAFDKVPTISEGATWILKAELEEGCVLPPPDVERLASRLSEVQAWQAQLHICQSIRYLLVPKKSAQSIEKWLKKVLETRRPFLRAWSVDAYCRLHGSSSKKTKFLLDRMEEDEAASVRARVRNLRREFEIR